MQTNSTGCLFDFCKYKPQIASFFIEPKLSSAVINALSSKTLPENYINNLQNEIKTLKISNYYFIKNWMKHNPIKAFLVGLLGSLLIALMGSFIYDLITK